MTELTAEAKLMARIEGARGYSLSGLSHCTASRGCEDVEVGPQG